MTQEEKAKAYDNALERAKSLYDYNQPISASNVIINNIFPELRESEDERIRKSLIILLQHFCKGYRVSGLNFSVSYKDMLAWLEKQDETFTKKDVNDALKGRYAWKPSEEQMDALETAVSSLQSNTLESLYQDLKREKNYE